MIKYPARILKDGKFFLAKFLDIPDAMTQGENMEELQENAEDILSLALSYLLENNMTIPEPSQQGGDDIIYIKPYHNIALPIMLKKRRKELNLSQMDVAKKMNVKYQTYQKLERAKINPTLKTLERAAETLGKKLILDFT
ncbi:MAG: type II toxin-antitoxin system HicB family antitoxin [Candidatus Eremiobacteraeota bacterium]|nr:type II toxin-antitoxin system HicB family antitoxin [Candidatus Eremiobacteraeota bacterium]